MSSSESLDQKEKTISLQVTGDEEAAQSVAPSVDGAKDPVAEPAIMTGETSRKDESVRTASQVSEVPDFAGRFDVLENIGEGGMGVVYKVFDPVLKKVFAVKVLRAVLTSDKQALKRFEREAQAAIKLNHPGLVSIYEHNVLADGTPYLVMDFIEGENLAQIIATHGRLEASRSLKIFDQVAEALEHVHEAGLVHRDVKPRNIILSKDESGDDAIKLVDFGIAKDASHIGATTVGVTQTGDFLGSPLYMSPEQCQGAELEARSDIYSAGCVLYELLTGATPFASNNPVKIVVGHLSEKPSLPSLVLAEKTPLTAELDMIILKCLEKNPDKRYQSASALREDLAAVLENRNPFQERVKQGRKGAGLALVFLALLILISVTSLAAPFEVMWSISNEMKPHAVPLFIASLTSFLAFSSLMSFWRSKGKSQLHKLAVVPWVVSYFFLIPSYIMLPHVPVDSSAIAIYLVAVVAALISTVVFWLKYAAIPKESFLSPLSASHGRIPTSEENRHLNLWRSCIFSTAVFGSLIFKAPQIELIAQYSPIVGPLILMMALGIPLNKVRRRLASPEKTSAGDRWLILACIAFATSAFAQAVSGFVQYQASMFLITTALSTTLSATAAVFSIAPILVGIVFLVVWLQRRHSTSPFGKTDGW